MYGLAQLVEVFRGTTNIFLVFVKHKGMPYFLVDVADRNGPVRVRYEAVFLQHCLRVTISFFSP